MIKTNLMTSINLILSLIIIKEVIGGIIINPSLGYNKPSQSKLGIYRRAAISTDANQCAPIGRSFIHIKLYYGFLYSN